MIRLTTAAILLLASGAASTAAETVFQSDFEASAAVSGSLTNNASAAVLNAGTATGTWSLAAAAPGAVIANAGGSAKAFCFDTVISGGTANVASGAFSRAVDLVGGEGLEFEAALYASRQGSGRQVRIVLQDGSGIAAYGLVFGLDNTKTFGSVDPGGSVATLATAGSVNTGFSNPAVDNYLSWSSGTMIRVKLSIAGQPTANGNSGAKLSVDWSGDGDFDDADEVTDVVFGPMNAGVTVIDRFELQYAGSSGNRGIYLDDVTATTVDPFSTDPYVWTGNASGGDDVSLYQEANWSLNGDNVTLIPAINPNSPVNLPLVVNSGNPGGGGATGTLDLGIGTLEVSGGNVNFNASSGLSGGSVTLSGGTIDGLFLENSTLVLSGGTLRLNDSGNPLRSGAIVDFSATSTGTIGFPNVSPASAISGQLPQIRVDGQAASLGVNVSILSDGSGGTLVTVFNGDPDSDDDNMNDAWEMLYFETLDRDGTGDFDSDGATDLSEYDNQTLPNNPDTDGDTLSDGAENKSGDWVSLSSTGTDPLKLDSDGDGAPDHIEINQGTDPNNPASKLDRPNIIFVLCDDLGYGDLGAFFQNQRATAGDAAEPWHITPQLDTIASEGIQLRGHYCPAPVCAPSRASLLLGVHQGHSNVRDNQFDKALEDNHTLATVLRSAGYSTYCIGKWGLQGGGSFPAHPMNRGFDGYFGYIGHGAGHAHYPKEDSKPLYDGFTEVSADFDKCYTTDLFTARAKKHLTDHHAAAPEQPFFLYLAYDTPHAELQVPTTAYPSGAGLSGGLQWTGTPGAMINSATGAVDSWFHPDYASATWDDPGVAGTTNPWPEVYKRYATMVRRIDDCMGDLVQTLKDLGIDDNTLIVFTSDNGPSKESYLSGTDANGYSRAYEPTFFESYGPFDGIKRDLWEGGIRVGAIARWPDAIPGNRTSDAPSQFHDWMPTFAAMAETAAPARSDGVSLLPTLTGVGIQQEPTTYVEYFEGGKTPNYTDFLGSRRNRDRDQMQMIRIGDMVGVRYGIAAHSNNFEIYNALNDPGQETNLAASNPTLQQRMKDRVLQIRRPNSSASRPYDGELVPADPPAGPVVGGLRFRGWNRLSTVVPDHATDVPDARSDTPAPDLALLPRATHCSAAFDGWIEIPADGTWTFELSTESKAVVRLHDANLLDADAGYMSGDNVSTDIPLKAGRHPIHIRYVRAAGPAPALALSWSGPGVALEPIPASAFFIDDGDDDGDSLSKSQESAAGTSDYDPDSDGDGLSDATDFDPAVPNETPGTPALSNASIPENVADAAVGNLSATNEAADTLAWSFASGAGDDDNGLFLLTDGVLSFVGSADFETKAAYSIRVRATDSGGLSSEAVFVIAVVDDEVGKTAAEWHQNEFGNAPVDWEADDDHDRLPRLLEYALGTSPFSDSSSDVPTIAWDGGIVRFEFTRRAEGFHDLIYQVQSSISLDDWQAAAAHEVSVTPGPPPELEQVVMELDAPVPPGVFLRLKVVLAE